MTEPPVLVPVMVNIVRLKSNAGVPLRAPVDVENARPVGKLGLIPQEPITPEPVRVGDNGRSPDAVLLTMLKSFGE